MKLIILSLLLTAKVVFSAEPTLTINKRPIQGVIVTLSHIPTNEVWTIQWTTELTTNTVWQQVQNITLLNRTLYHETFSTNNMFFRGKKLLLSPPTPIIFP